jgi:hypothetical protein
VSRGFGWVQEAVLAFAVREAYGDSRFSASWWPVIQLHREPVDSAARRAARSLYERGLIDLDYMSEQSETGAVRRLQHMRLGHLFGARTKVVYRGFPETVDHVVALAATEVALLFAPAGAKSDHWETQGRKQWEDLVRRRTSVVKYHRRTLDGLAARGRFSAAWAACQVLSGKTTAVGGLTWWQILCGLDDNRFVPKLPGGWDCPAFSTPEVRTALSHLGVQDDLGELISRNSKAQAAANRRHAVDTPGPP